MFADLLQKLLRIISVAASHQISEHTRQFLNIRFLTLYIGVIRHKLRQLLGFLRRKINIFRDGDLLLHRLIAGRQTGQLLIDRPIQVFRLFLDDPNKILVLFQHGGIGNITADTAAGPSAQNLPCRSQVQLSFPFSIGRRHDDRAHIDLAYHLFIPI